jgi:hypothetical protein
VANGTVSLMKTVRRVSLTTMVFRLMYFTSTSRRELPPGTAIRQVAARLRSPSAALPLELPHFWERRPEGRLSSLLCSALSAKRTNSSSRGSRALRAPPPVSDAPTRNGPRKRSHFSPHFFFANSSAAPPLRSMGLKSTCIS